MKLFESQRGLELSSLQWLLDHHRTKEAARRQMVDDLQFQPGDVILDLGCGPGLWTSMFADKVGPSGKVIGLDFSPELIGHALAERERRSDDHVVEFVLGDFYAAPFKDQAFDAVFVGNCASYIPDVLELLGQHSRVTKRGGRVIAKEFDGAALIFHPIDPHLTLKVLAAAARALVENPPLPPFDNFTGRKMHGIFRQAGLKEVATSTYAIQKVPPLAPEEKRYMRGNAEWYGRTAAPYLSEEELERWMGAFDPDSERYILDRDEFYFCMVEMMTVGRV